MGRAVNLLGWIFRHTALCVYRLCNLSSPNQKGWNFVVRLRLGHPSKRLLSCSRAALCNLLLWRPVFNHLLHWCSSFQFRKRITIKWVQYAISNLFSWRWSFRNKRCTSARLWFKSLDLTFSKTVKCYLNELGLRNILNSLIWTYRGSLQIRLLIYAIDGKNVRSV